MIQSSHYAALGLHDHERSGVIRSAYRDLVRRYHPARVGPGGEENFRAIADAYSVLSDSSLRRSYDDARSRENAAPAPRPARPTSEDGPMRGFEPRAPRVENMSLQRAPSMASRIGEALLARFARNFTGIGVPKSESAHCLHVRFIIGPPRHPREDVVIRLRLPVLVSLPRFTQGTAWQRSCCAARAPETGSRSPRAPSRYA